MSRSRLAALAALLGSLALAQAVQAQPAAAGQPATLAEAMSYDGLKKTHIDGIDIAYVLPGASLAAYRSVQLLPVEVSFYKNWNPNIPGQPWSLTTDQRDQIKATVVKLVTASFTKELTKAGYPVVAAPGPDVLMVRIYIINLDIATPAVMTAGMNTQLSSGPVGQATIYVELHDSQTGQTLGRFIDTQVAQNEGTVMVSSVTNYAAGERVADAWAERLVKGLESARSAPAVAVQ